MGDESSSQSWIFDMFILVLSYRSRTLRSQKFTSQISEFFDKILVRIIFDVLCRVFGFAKAPFNSLKSSFLYIPYLNFVAILALGRKEGYHGIFAISHVKL